MAPPVDPRRSELLVVAAAAAALACAVALVFFGAGVLTGREVFFTHEYASSDIWHLNLPTRAFYQRELHAGRWPLWCPEMGTGFPLLAAAETGALYPVNLLLFGTLPLTTAFNLALVAALACAAASSAMLARQLGAPRACALFVAGVFAFSGFFLVHLKHPAMIATAAWAPAVLLGVERFVVGGRRTTLTALAVVVGMCATAGHPQLLFNALLIGGAWAVARALTGACPAARAVPRLGALAGAVGLGLALAAPQLLATYELHGCGPRSDGLDAAAARWELHRLEHLAHFVAPGRLGDPGALIAEQAVVTGADGVPRTAPMLRGYEDDGEPPSLFWEVTGYLGILPLLLAGVALVARRERRVGLLAGLLGFAVLLMLGPGGGLATVLARIVPGFDLFRFHGRFIVHAALALALLAGLGLGWLLDAVPRSAGRWRVPVGCGAALVIVLLDVHTALGDHNPTVAAGHWVAPPPTAGHVLAAGDGAAPPSRLASTDRDRRVFENAYNRARGWKGDLAPYEPARLMLAPDLNVLHGVPHLGLWGPLYPRWAMTIAQAVHGPPVAATSGAAPPGARARHWRDGIASMFNVGWVLDPFGELAGRDVRYPVAATWPGDVRLRGRLLIEDGRYDVTLRQNAVAMPRAFLVGGAVSVAGDAEALACITAPGFDPRTAVALIGGDAADATGPAPAPRGQVSFRSYAPQRVVLDVETAADAWLFLSDTWYPGWRARVAGEAVAIRRANVAGRAVRVPAGRHEVELVYDPAPFRQGWWWVWAALLGIIALASPLPQVRGRRDP